MLPLKPCLIISLHWALPLIPIPVTLILFQGHYAAKSFSCLDLISRSVYIWKGQNEKMNFLVLMQPSSNLAGLLITCTLRSCTTAFCDFGLYLKVIDALLMCSRLCQKLNAGIVGIEHAFLQVASILIMMPHGMLFEF